MFGEKISVKCKGVSPIVASVILIVIVLSTSFIVWNFANSVWGYTNEAKKIIFHVAVYDQLSAPNVHFIGGSIKNCNPYPIKILYVEDSYGNKYLPFQKISESTGVILQYLEIEPYQTIELKKVWEDEYEYGFINEFWEEYNTPHYDKIILYFYLSDGTKIEVNTIVDIRPY